MVALLALAPVWLHAEKPDRVIAVYSAVSPTYQRATLATGAIKPETYAFGDGGAEGGGLADFTLDQLSFLDVAKAIAPSLASQNYVACDPKDPTHTDLLIMVYWGRTIGTDRTSTSTEYQNAQHMAPPPRAAMSPIPNGVGDCGMVSDPSTSGRMSEGQLAAALKSADDSAQQQSLLLTAGANRQRDRQNRDNGVLLGYAEEMKRVAGYQMTAFNTRRQDVLDEVEESRYFVVLLAYDFPTLLKKKERKLLWETRYSLPARRNDFTQQLPLMSQSAARYFGKDSHGLNRKELPATNVKLGELKSLGEAAASESR